MAFSNLSINYFLSNFYITNVVGFLSGSLQNFSNISTPCLNSDKGIFKVSNKFKLGYLKLCFKVSSYSRSFLTPGAYDPNFIGSLIDKLVLEFLYV